MNTLHQALHDLADPQRLANAIQQIFELVLIAVGAWAATRLSRSLVRRTAAWRSGHSIARLTPVVEGLLRYTILFVALILVLETFHVDITPLLASAGLLGVALGFGAQYLVRDLIAGIFLLSEGIIRVGDVVHLDDEVGTVESLTLRTTQIRKFSGELLTVPNGTISRIGNLSRGFSRAIVQVLVPYSADVQTALEALRDVGRAWAVEGVEAPALARLAPQADPTVRVVELRDAGAVLQIAVLVPPSARDAAASDLRQRVLEALGRRGITPGWISALPSLTGSR